MKLPKLKLVLLFSLLFGGGRVFAQTPQQIEADLLKSFKKIDYWDNKQRTDTTGDTSISINLFKANDVLAKKLQSYAIHNPATITYPFTNLKKEHLDVSTSDDGLFRIYSWDTLTGGTMHFFENVFQYKVGNKTYAVLDTPNEEGDVRPWYTKLYTLRTNGHAYYLALNISIGSTIIYGGSIQVFDIENGRLNDSVKLIKTQSGLHSNLEFDCDLSKSAGKLTLQRYPSIEVDILKQTISIPLIAENGVATTKHITYKFTGQYFERVKN